jgi:hypothetical protein
LPQDLVRSTPFKGPLLLGCLPSGRLPGTQAKRKLGEEFTQIALTALIILVAATSAAAGRDFSTPSTRIVGHWESRDGTEFYFGPIDTASEIGSLTWVETNADGRVVKHGYKILGETPDDKDLTIQVEMTAGGNQAWTFRVYRDGYAMSGQKRILGIKLDKGKPPKVILIACARKLLTILNAMVRDQSEWKTMAA